MYLPPVFKNIVFIGGNKKPENIKIIKNVLRAITRYPSSFSQLIIKNGIHQLYSTNNNKKQNQKEHRNYILLTYVRGTSGNIQSFKKYPNEN